MFGPCNTHCNITPQVLKAQCIATGELGFDKSQGYSPTYLAPIQTDSIVVDIGSGQSQDFLDYDIPVKYNKSISN